MKNRILFILHIPPPVHGAAMVGHYIQNSKIINETFECQYINLSTTTNMGEIDRWKLNKISAIFRLYLNVLSTVIRSRYDFCYMTINSHGLSYYKEMIIVLILKLLRCKMVFHYHNKGIQKYQGKWLLNKIYSFQFRNSRAILLSELLYPDLSKYLPREKVYFCPNGIPSVQHIDLDFQILKRNSKTTPEILFLSNMMEAKGVYIFLEACNILNTKKVKFQANFIGAWADIKQNDFNAFVVKNKLERKVVYAGERYGNEKSEFFNAADIFVHPTLNDCFPLVVLEAMQHGLPVISSDEKALPEIIENSISGYIIPKNDPAALAEKIELLIRNPFLRSRMGKNALKKFNDSYTLNIFEQNFIKTLKQISLDLD